MDGATQSARPTSLVVELGSGTAVVDGERIELPSKELKLLAELAARPGEAVASSELIAAVWPEVPWMTSQDLYWHISQLRRDLGGSERARKMIRNRRGFGYFLELPREAVMLSHGSSRTMQPAQAPQEDPVEELPPSPVYTVEDDDFEDESAPVSKPFSRSSSVRALLMAVLLFGLIAVSWSAGFLLSTRRATESVAGPNGTVAEPDAEPQQEKAQEPSEQPRKKGNKKHGDEKKKKDRSPERPREETGVQNDAVAAAPTTEPETSSPSTSPSTNSPGQQDPGGSSSAGAQKQAQQQSSLPPAPTRYLYHLVSEETGDHFVTTDGSVASEREAKGYKGGAIARVYTSSEADTKAITTNHGTAYIFTGSDPDTDPASKTTPLWYSTDDDGDFFYTTSEADASQAGWSATLIGYVRTLS